MKKLAILFLLVFICQGVILSQTESQTETESKITVKDMPYKNVVKLNTLSLVFKNVSLFYERAITPRISASMGFGYKFANPEPRILKGDNEQIVLNPKGIEGHTITPEVRYYIKKCDQTIMDGFYVGLYFRYTHYKSGTHFDYYPANGNNQTFDGNIKLDEYGVGFQLGYQLVIYKRLMVDFMFLGPRYSRYKLQYGFDENVSQAFLDDLSNYMNDIIDKFGYDYKVNLETKGSRSAKGKFGFVNLRVGISLCFAF
ncbi:DUF3575 domain-containing protein [Bacteroidota bacterium]